MAEYRLEYDSMGDVRVPADALYGAQTQRAVDNFPISGIHFPSAFLRALAQIKWCASAVNELLGRLDSERATAIRSAADEIIDGRWSDQFPLDIFQTGSGTSTNMNMNEVVAARAGQLLAARGVRLDVHPNDHVNMSQSSNDVIPSAIHISAGEQVRDVLAPGLGRLEASLRRQALKWQGTIKTGRTHLMDATPLTLGQEMGGWTHQIAQGSNAIKKCLPALYELAIGGTAVGTGLNAPADFGRLMASQLSQRTGLPWVETPNHFAAQSSLDALTSLSGQLKQVASSLEKIANDLRWMNSGPNAGLGEIRLPALQPGSSIMPGKINPVVCEAVMMVCVQVIANDVAVTIANGQGNFQLNVMMPLIAHNILQSILILGNAADVLGRLAIDGMDVEIDGLRGKVEHNPILVTVLGPVIGYDKATLIARRAFEECRPIREIVIEETDLSTAELERLLDVDKMVCGDR